MATYKRRGFRLPNNTLLLLIVFFTIGLFLHYGGKTKPVVAFWETVKSTLSGDAPPSQNPYKVPEPNEDTIAFDDSGPRSQSRRTPAQKSASEVPSGKGLSEENSEELVRIINQKDFFLPATSPTDQLVRRAGYTLQYVERYELPAWVAYPLVASQIKGSEERENAFMPDPVVKSGTAVSADYTRTGYDRGHMAPAADFKNSYQNMKESFYMSNICPQKPEFNRGVWLELEKMVRVWAYKYNRVFVVTGPVLKPGLPTIGRFNRVAVPEHYYKVVLYADPPYIKGIAFVLPNAASTAPLSAYVVSIDEVEQITGLDFFPRLPDTIEQKVEARSLAKEWYRLK